MNIGAPGLCGLVLCGCAAANYAAMPAAPSFGPEADFHSVAGEGATRTADPLVQYAQQQATPGAYLGEHDNVADPGASATDAIRPTQVLIYTATLQLAVYEVQATQERILAVVTEHDGFLSEQSDLRLVIRVPAPHFQAALDAIAEQGDVLHRHVSTTDVGEEFFDLTLRIRNAEAMRDRLEALLERAENVEAALAVERELQRITEEIERMKGRQRYLADQARYSTITVNFAPHPSAENDPGPFQLPFDWLRELGLSSLLRL